MALFVSNPRRRRRSSRSRRNGLTAKQLAAGFGGKSRMRNRRNGTKKGQRRRTARRAYVRNPYKDTMIMKALGISRAAVKALKRKSGKTAAQYKRDIRKYNAAFRKAGGQGTLNAHNSQSSRDARSKARKKRVAAWKKSRGGTTKTRRRTTGRRKKLSPAQLKAGFGGRARMNPRRGRSNPLALFKNPRRRRRNALALKRNPIGFAPLDWISGTLSRFGGPGRALAEQVAPVFFGGVSAAGVIYIHSLVDRYTDFYSRYGLDRFSYTLAGVTGSIVTLALSSALPPNLRNSARIAAAAMSTLGAGFDVYREMQRRAVMEALAQQEAALPGQNGGYGAYEYTGGGALNGIHRAYNSNPTADAYPRGVQLLQPPGQGGLAMDFGAHGAPGAHGAHGASGAYGALIYTGGNL